MTEWCLSVYLYVCTDKIQNIYIGTLGTCMGPYFVYVQVLGWVWFLGSRGTSLVIQWHRLPLRGHQSHFPCICSSWHLGSTLSWRRLVILWHAWGSSVIPVDALHTTLVLMHCVALHRWHKLLPSMSAISTRLNVLSKAMAWHNGPFSKRSFNTFSFPCPSNLFVEYI